MAAPPPHRRLRQRPLALLLALAPLTALAGHSAIHGSLRSAEEASGAQRLVPKPTPEPFRERPRFKPQRGEVRQKENVGDLWFPDGTVPKWTLVLAIFLCSLSMAGLHYYISKDEHEAVAHVNDGHANCLMGGGRLRKLFQHEKPLQSPPEQTSSTRSLTSLFSRRAAPEKQESALHRCDTTKRDNHRVMWQNYFALGFWLLMIVVQASFTRLLCQHGIPHDCQKNLDLVSWVRALHMMLAYGIIVAVLAAVPRPDRFHYLFCFRWAPNDGDKLEGVFFLAIFFLSCPVFGVMDLVPAVNGFSLKAGGTMGMVNIILLVVVGGGFVFLCAWHLWYCYWQDYVKGRTPDGFIAYAISRGVIWFIYGAYFIGASDASAITFHMHHYIVGFLFAILAEFNHPMSLALLAGGTGVMIQGIAAYGADPITTRAYQHQHYG